MKKGMIKINQEEMLIKYTEEDIERLIEEDVRKLDLKIKRLRLNFSTKEGRPEILAEAFVSEKLA